MKPYLVMLIDTRYNDKFWYSVPTSEINIDCNDELLEDVNIDLKPEWRINQSDVLNGGFEELIILWK